MKVKNLLLAGLAVAAMTACSNEIDEIVDNGGQVGEKTALMEFGINFPVQTRATEIGLPAEQEFSSATLIVEYTDGKTQKSIIEIPRNQFTKDDSGKLYTKEKIAVEPKEANVHVVLNASPIASALNGTSWKTSTYTGSYATGSLKGIASITGDKEFLMSGSSSDTYTFQTGTSTNVYVPVKRVAAKLEEMTPTNNSFEVENSNDNGSLKDAAGNAVTLDISVTEYSYANLQQTSYVFEQTTPITASLFQPYDLSVFTFTGITGETTGENSHGDITYCLENYGTNPTMALYKATAKINDVAQTIWVDRNNVLFTTASEVNAAYSSITEGTSIADCWKYGVRKYENGVCYYKANILTNNEDAKIVRNNVYKLTVTGIAKLGSPEPKDEPSLAELKLTVDVAEWTIQTNDFTLQ